MGGLRVWLPILTVYTLVSCGAPEPKGSLSAEGTSVASAPELPDPTAEQQAFVDAFPRDRFEIVEVPEIGRFYVDDNPTLVKQEFREGRAWSPHVVRELRTHVRRGSTALDIGAHIGSLTVPMARLVGQAGRVYAFEPQGAVHRELHHNLALNELDHAVALRLAVSDRPGTLEMAPPLPDDGWNRLGQGGESVEARTLDSFGFRDVSVIKIDVEGHELAVLRGATETILAQRPALLIEIAPDNVAAAGALLTEWGYRVRRLEDQPP